MKTKQWTHVKAENKEIEIKALRPNQGYEFIVRAVCKAGVSPIGHEIIKPQLIELAIQIATLRL